MKDKSAKTKTKDNLIYPGLSYKIVGALFEVHNELGGGLQEKHYQKALAKVLRDKNIGFKEQIEIPIRFRGEKLSNYFLDFLIEEKIIVELKTKRFLKEYYSQLNSYLKKTDKKLGIVAIFGKDELRYKRIVNLY